MVYARPNDDESKSRNWKKRKTVRAALFILAKASFVIYSYRCYVTLKFEKISLIFLMDHFEIKKKTYYILFLN